MTLEELKVRLGATTASDEYLKFLLDDALVFVESACNQTFRDVEKFPRGLNPIIAKYVKYELQGEDLVKSESIAGMSQTFASKDELKQSLINELSRLRLRKIRFTSLGGW